LTPKDRAGCKRLIMSGEFYAALQRPNARLVTEGIESIEPEGITKFCAMNVRMKRPTTRTEQMLAAASYGVSSCFCS